MTLKINTIVFHTEETTGVDLLRRSVSWPGQELSNIHKHPLWWLHHECWFVSSLGIRSNDWLIQYVYVKCATSESWCWSTAPLHEYERHRLLRVCFYFAGVRLPHLCDDSSVRLSLFVSFGAAAAAAAAAPASDVYLTAYTRSYPSHVILSMTATESSADSFLLLAIWRHYDIDGPVTAAVAPPVFCCSAPKGEMEEELIKWRHASFRLSRCSCQASATADCHARHCLLIVVVDEHISSSGL